MRSGKGETFLGRLRTDGRKNGENKSAFAKMERMAAAAVRIGDGQHFGVCPFALRIFLPYRVCADGVGLLHGELSDFSLCPDDAGVGFTFFFLRSNTSGNCSSLGLECGNRGSIMSCILDQFAEVDLPHGTFAAQRSAASGSGA